MENLGDDNRKIEQHKQTANDITTEKKIMHKKNGAWLIPDSIVNYAFNKHIYLLGIGWEQQWIAFYVYIESCVYDLQLN